MYIILKNKKNINIFWNILIKYIIYLSFGDVLKWLRGHPAKVLDRSAMHGFESHRLRHFKNNERAFILMNNIKKTSERIVGIEILRYILMMFLVFQHLQEQCLPENQHGFLPIVATITVPAFFMITGFFDNGGGNRFYKFLKIFLSWMIFGIIFQEIFYLCNLAPLSPFEQIFTFQYIKDGLSTWWFLYILFWIYLFSPYIHKFINNYFKASCILSFLLFLLLNFWMYQIFIYKTQTLDGYMDFITPIMLLRGFFYFMLGVIFKKIKLNSFSQMIIGLIFITIYFIFLFGIKQLYYDKQPNPDYFWFDMARNYFSIILILGSCGLILFFSNINPKNKFINSLFYLLGKVSICIYLFHGLFFDIFQKFIPSWNIETSILSSSSYTCLYLSILSCSTVFGFIFLIPQKYLLNSISIIFDNFTNWYEKIS